MCSKCDDFWCELDEDGEHFDNYPPSEEGEGEGGWGFGCLSLIALTIAILLI